MAKLGKYELLTQIGTALDENERLSRKVEQLKSELYMMRQVEDGGDPPEFIPAIYRAGVKALCEDVCNFYWNGVGVKREGGELVPETDFDSWAHKVVSHDSIPPTVSFEQFMTAASWYLRDKYDERWQKDLKAYTEKEDEDGD